MHRLVSSASVLVAVAHANIDSAVMGEAGRRQRDLPDRLLRDRRVGRTLGASSARGVAGPLNRERNSSLPLDPPWFGLARWCPLRCDAVEAVARRTTPHDGHGVSRLV